MILSDDEILEVVLAHVKSGKDGNRTGDFARAIEAKVLEKLGDKLRDAERYRWLRDSDWLCLI